MIFVIIIGCTGYRKPTYTSSDKDVVQQDEIHTFSIKKAMKKNSKYYWQKFYDINKINFGKYQTLKVKCYRLYNKYYGHYKNDYKQFNRDFKTFKSELLDDFISIYITSTMQYLADNLTYKFLHIYPEQLWNIFNMDYFVEIMKSKNNSIALKEFSFNKSNSRYKIKAAYEEANAGNYIVDLGKEILFIEVNNNRLKLTRSKDSKIKGIDIDKLYNFLICYLGNNHNFYKNYFPNKIQNMENTLNEKYKNKFEKLNNKAKLLSNINNEGLSCSLIGKNLSFFEDKNDLSIKQITKTSYKDKLYLTIKALYLNVFNNINIKFNDQYKISRYLFDHLVRQGVREFLGVYQFENIDGILFKMTATDKNFVKDENPSNFSIYEFYMPEKESLLYINDDITGQDLADNSYILVNDERIELR